MKIYITLAVIFLSFTILAYSGLFEIPHIERIGSTELNGDGCVCHSLYEDQSVKVWVEGPETLAVGQTGLYKMFLAGGPAEAGGYNVAGRFGTMGIVDTISKWDYRAPNELTQAFPLVFTTPQDTIFWPFEYTASDSFDIDTIYSCGLSIVYDSIPDFHDVWAFGSKFPLTIVDEVTPVELISFNIQLDGRDAFLIWKTASELNNKGFEIQKNYSSGWNTIGFINGKGTTSEISEYVFVDKNLKTVSNLYRLKQIDYDGRLSYSDIVKLNAEGLFANFELNQNYPNPFNPTTVISWQLAVSSHVTLKVYDVLGNEVATLVSEEKPAGKYEVEFSALDGSASGGDASVLSSGLYLFKLEAGSFSQTKKMLLLK